MPLNKETKLNVKSNHPASIVKQIPNVINIRINRLSPSINIFNNNNDSYHGACGVMVIVVGNGHGDTSSNPG